MIITNKRFTRALIVLAAMFLISMELPYSDKALIQYIIPVIRISTVTLYLAGIIPLIGAIWSYKEIVKSNRFKASRLMIFIVLFFMVSPFVMRNINIIKAPIYYFSSGVRTIEIKDSNIGMTFGGDEELLHIELELKSYGNNLDGIRIAVILSDSLGEYVESNYFLIDKVFRLHKTQSLSISEDIPVDFIDEHATVNNFYSDLHYDDYKIVLMDDEGQMMLSRNDGY